MCACVLSAHVRVRLLLPVHARTQVYGLGVCLPRENTHTHKACNIALLFFSSGTGTPGPKKGGLPERNDPDRLKKDTFFWKKAAAGVLLSLREEIFALSENLEKNPVIIKIMSVRCRD